MLTKKQTQVLDFIKTYMAKHSYAPSLEEIKKKFKLASVSTAHYYISKLQDAGFLNNDHNQPRAVSTIEAKQTVEIPILGAIAAGQPIEAI
ncbi:MAG: repressor LexA, partial [Candidatus Adlerbacteria bacterium]|nr:repressor LexA [Candidatus Adlerbacteria bacterium]